jgi:hypothetical protein
MSVQAVLLPVFAQVLLVVILAALMARRRYRAVQRREVRRDEVILGQRNWPPRAQAAANAYSNQFELPVLFFALVPLALLTRKADLLFVVLSWIFVVSRYVHGFVYVTSNALPFRLGSFALGAIVLLVMWIVFAVRILAVPTTV